MNFFEEIISILFPRRCPVCDEVIESGTLICEECHKKVKYLKEPICKRCGKTIDNERIEYCGDCRKKQHFFTQGRAVFEYTDQWKLSMYRFKYSNKREYADYYAMEAGNMYLKWIQDKEIEAIIPIPMYKWKQRKRGYNQAEVFAKSLSKVCKIKEDSKLVMRVRNTTPQKELNDIQRKENLKKAFKMRTDIVKYRKVLLVDDIYTTGSTMDAVAEVLLTAGVEQVFFICICIGKGY